MQKTFQKLKSLKSAIIASLLLSMMFACNNNVQDIKPLEKNKPSGARAAAYTFNWTPNLGPRLSYDVTGMNVTNKNAVITEARRLGGEDFAAYAIAIAMLETEKIISNTGPAGSSGEYPWMDSKPGFEKSGDSANFGVYKMNWYLIRNSATYVKLGLGAYSYGTYGGTGYGQQINNSVPLATKLLYDYYSKIKNRPDGEFGDSSSDMYIGKAYSFWGGHRYGQTGWKIPGTGSTGVDIARNNQPKGWNDTILYWFAVKVIKTWINDPKFPGRMNSVLYNTKKRLAYDIYNI